MATLDSEAEGTMYTGLQRTVVLAEQFGAPYVLPSKGSNLPSTAILPPATSE